MQGGMNRGEGDLVQARSEMASRTREGSVPPDSNDIVLERAGSGLL